SATTETPHCELPYRIRGPNLWDRFLEDRLRALGFLARCPPSPRRPAAIRTFDSPADGPSESRDESSCGLGLTRTEVPAAPTAARASSRMLPPSFCTRTETESAASSSWADSSTRLVRGRPTTRVWLEPARALTWSLTTDHWLPAGL